MENSLDSVALINAKDKEIAGLRRTQAKTNGAKFDLEMKQFVSNGKFDSVAWAKTQIGRPMSASIVTTIGNDLSPMKDETSQEISIIFENTPLRVIPSLGDSFTFSHNGHLYSFSIASRGTAILVALFGAGLLKTKEAYTVNFVGATNGIPAHIRLSSSFEKKYDELLASAITAPANAITPQIDALGD